MTPLAAKVRALILVKREGYEDPVFSGRNCPNGSFGRRRYLTGQGSACKPGGLCNAPSPLSSSWPPSSGVVGTKVLT